MAFLFRPGGPQVGVRALALMAGATALAVPGAALAADISILPDRARLSPLSERIATIAIGNPLIAAAAMASVTICGGGRAQRDCGRFSV